MERLRYVKRNVVKGREYWFFRRDGTSTPLVGNPYQSQEAAQQYWSLFSGAANVVSGYHSMSRLIKSYKQSQRFQRLAPRTKVDYLALMELIERDVGNADARSMPRKEILRAQAAYAATPRRANYIVTMLGILFEHAIDLDWRETNPAKGIRKLPQGDGYLPWPEDMIGKFREHAKGPTLIAFELALGTGQRIGDVLRMNAEDIFTDRRAGWRGIGVVQGKTAARLKIPFTKHLDAFLQAHAAEAGPLVRRLDGSVLSYRALHDRLTSVRDKIEAQAYSWHGLRYNAVIELIEAGATIEQVKAITGHRTVAMVLKYSEGANQLALARTAQTLRA